MTTISTTISTTMSTNDTTMSTTMSTDMCHSMATMMTIIGHLSNISLKIISVVVDTLETTIREVDRVVALAVTSTITALALIEAGTGVAISNIVLEGVWDDLREVMVATISTVSNDATMVATDASKADSSSRDGSHQARDAEEDLEYGRCIVMVETEGKEEEVVLPS